MNFLNNNRVGNDQVSSAKVQPLGTTECAPGNNQVSFFLHAGFLAPCVVKNIGNYANATQIGLDDKRISSIKVGPGALACTYNENDFSGPSQSFTSSSDFLGSDNDLISSVKVQAAGTTCQETRRPFIVAGIEPFSPGSQFQLLRIRGNGFQAAELVRLQITTKSGNNNPVTVNEKRPRMRLEISTSNSPAAEGSLHPWAARASIISGAGHWTDELKGIERCDYRLLRI